jgi:hypothetical protein
LFYVVSQLIVYVDLQLIVWIVLQSIVLRRHPERSEGSPVFCLCLSFAFAFAFCLCLRLAVAVSVLLLVIPQGSTFVFALSIPDRQKTSPRPNQASPNPSRKINFKTLSYFSASKK